MPTPRPTLALLLAGVLLATGLAASASSPAPTTPERDLLPGVGALTPYRGDLHAHTGYSDGEDDPEAAFGQAHAAGWLDFFAITDHSEWFLFPFVANSGCIEPGDEEFGDPACAQPVTPLPGRTEWEETGYQAQRFTDHGFLAVRGFEWSSPIEGHVNVYETTLWTDAVQTAPAPMTGFYAWLAGQVHDADRYATFNHPGREPLLFDGFAYDARADQHIVGLESFNRDDDYTGFYLEALDAGWRVGTHGVTDGHSPEARLDREAGHTVALMDELTQDGLARAMVQHHTVAIRGSTQDARLLVDDVMLGDTLTDPTPGGTVTVTYHLLDSEGTAFEQAELWGPQGWRVDLDIAPAPEVQGTAEVAWEELPTTEAGERYLVLRGHQAYQGQVAPTVQTSAVWIAPAPPAPPTPPTPP